MPSVFDLHRNLAYSGVATAPTPATSGLSLVLNGGGGALMPAAPFNATVWPTGTSPTPANAEIVRVTNIATDTLTIVRAQELSSARTIVAGDQFAASITAKTVTDVEGQSGAGLQAGVYAAGDCALTINSTSQVTIAAGSVWVNNASAILLPVTVTSTAISGIPVATNNRIDQIVVDSTGTVSRLAGTTDVAGNTLAANPSSGGGRAAIPAGSQLLHDLQVTSGGVTAVNTHDRRPWARGAWSRVLRTTNAAGGNDYAITGNLAEIDTTNLKLRIECTGNPLRLALKGQVFINAAGFPMEVGFAQDGTVLDGASVSTRTTPSIFDANTSSDDAIVHYARIVIPAAGTHLFGPMAGNIAGAGTMTLRASAGRPLEFVIEEITRPNANNGTS